MFSLQLIPEMIMIQSLQITGGATESIFQEAERFLLSSSDHQRALEQVAVRKKMDNYRSMIDFVFCELHSEWRGACKRYYAGSGPQLRYQISTEQIVDYDRRLVVALGVAYRLFCDGRCRNWTQYKFEVRQALAA